MPFKQVHLNLPRWAIIVLVCAPFAMGCVATWAVIRGNERTNANCEAVHGLREDLVEVVKDSEQRSEAAIKDAFDGNQEERLLNNLHSQTQSTLNKIEDPQCP